VRYRIPTTVTGFIHQIILITLISSLFSRVAVTSLIAATFGPQPQDVFLSRPLSFPFSPIIAQSATTLGKGKFLVASRDLNDPNFAESVILLLDYNEKGALGVIINRPTEVSLAELLPDVKALQKRQDVVYIGGPVAQQMLMILIHTAKPPPDAQLVFSDTYLVAKQTGLAQVLQSDGKRTKLRAYIGYAGWAAGQLDMEVAAGGWQVVPADPLFIFDRAAQEIWPELIRRGAAQWTSNQPPESSLRLAHALTPYIETTPRVASSFALLVAGTARPTCPCGLRSGSLCLSSSAIRPNLGVFCM